MSGRICEAHEGHAGTGSPSTLTESPSDATAPQLVHTSRSQLPRVVSAPDSTVKIYVFPTNEELAIARQALTFA